MARPLRHTSLPLSTGITCHYVDLEPPAGTPTLGTVVMVHGFPDTWFGWRKQIRAVADCGYHVVVPDQRGYGDTSAPAAAAEYRQELLCADMISLLDALLVPHAVFFGHDWGGTLVWNLAQMYPQRVSHVAAVCTPFFPQPETDPFPRMLAKPGRFDYQVWFQFDAAQWELQEDPRRSVRCMLRTHDEERWPSQPPTKQRGMLKHYPADLGRSRLLTDEEEDFYTAQFRRSGFRGPMGWYRNVSENWAWMRPSRGRKVLQESLMVTAAHDRVLTASMAKRLMPQHVPNCRFENVDGAGHWVLQERPDEVNKLLVSFLRGIKPAQHIRGGAKL